MKNRKLYPGLKEAEEQREARPSLCIPPSEAPDFIGTAPNYDKYKGWPPDKVLAFLNID